MSTHSIYWTKDYLKTVTGGTELVESTLKQWENVTTSLNSIPY
jgi:hypothetical protein